MLQVILIQACQDNTAVALSLKGKGDPAVPGQVSDPLRDQHITLTRRHTVLLLSTVREGKSIRGAFTGAMADQFSCTDGKTDISEMFYKAAHKVTHDHRCKQINQTPKCELTLDKKLVLPRPAASDEFIDVHRGVVWYDNSDYWSIFANYGPNEYR